MCSPRSSFPRPLLSARPCRFCSPIPQITRQARSVLFLTYVDVCWAFVLTTVQSTHAAPGPSRVLSTSSPAGVAVAGYSTQHDAGT